MKWGPQADKWKFPKMPELNNYHVNTIKEYFSSARIRVNHPVGQWSGETPGLARVAWKQPSQLAMVVDFLNRKPPSYWNYGLSK
jgi:hypothetical protein